MARSTMDFFAQQNTERATDWMRAIAEQSLNQSKAAFDGLLSVARNALRDLDQQTAAICEHTVSFAEGTLSNTFDFAHKLLRMKEPQEFAQIQSEFVSRQAQLVGDQAKELGQRMIQGAQNAAQHAARSTHEAAAESSSEDALRPPDATKMRARANPVTEYSSIVAPGFVDIFGSWMSRRAGWKMHVSLISKQTGLPTRVAIL